MKWFGPREQIELDTPVVLAVNNGYYVSHILTNAIYPQVEKYQLERDNF